MVTCTKDDSGSCCGKCGTHNVVAVIPVHGRLPLLKYTIQRLYQKNKVKHVICVGSEPEERKVCESAGAQWVQHKNKPLGQKWNMGFKAARKHYPDACLFVGSSDWLSDNWLNVALKNIGDFDLIGTLGCHFLDIGNSLRLCHWPGYIGRREGESIGIGRVISSKVLEKMHWSPFNDMLHRSLDGSMQQNVTLLAGKTQVIDIKNAFSMSISTNQWANLHRFEDHWNNILPSHRVENAEEFIQKHFPEVHKIFNPTL